MMRFLVAATLGLLLVGCGAPQVTAVNPARTTGRQALAPETASHLAAKGSTGRTGVGNPYSVSILSWGPTSLSIDYDDQKHYFSTDLAISAYLKVWTRSGRVIEIPSVSLNHPSGGTTVFGGYARLDGVRPQDIAAAEVSFYRYDRWDSNYGHNYRVTF